MLSNLLIQEEITGGNRRKAKQKGHDTQNQKRTHNEERGFDELDTHMKFDTPKSKCSGEGRGLTYLTSLNEWIVKRGWAR